MQANTVYLINYTVDKITVLVLSRRSTPTRRVWTDRFHRIPSFERSHALLSDYKRSHDTCVLPRKSHSMPVLLRLRLRFAKAGDNDASWFSRFPRGGFMRTRQETRDPSRPTKSIIQGIRVRKSTGILFRQPIFAFINNSWHRLVEWIFVSEQIYAKCIN